MRVRPFGDRALLLECGGTAEVRAAYAEALQRREAGELTCTDVVPAARTLLLDGLEDVRQVVAGVDEWPDRADRRGRRRAGRAAGDLRRPRPGVGRRAHRARRRRGGRSGTGSVEFVVAFCGFAPGFAYLTGLPEELEVPRLDEPRSKVPAGSVGLAGDVHRGLPALLTRRVAADRAHRRGPVGRRAGSAGTAGARARGCGSPMAPEMTEPRSLEVTDAGLQVTVQDLGRPGQAHLGVPALRCPRRTGAPAGQPPRGKPGVGRHAGVPRRPRRVPDPERRDRGGHRCAGAGPGRRP